MMSAMMSMTASPLISLIRILFSFFVSLPSRYDKTGMVETKAMPVESLNGVYA
jgi:hypothetical protein